jgi:hypothetical protein
MKSGSGAADLEFGRDSVRMKVDDPLKTKIEAAHYAPIAVSAKHFQTVTLRTAKSNLSRVHWDIVSSVTEIRPV